MKQMTKIKTNQRVVIGALALSIVLAVPLTVYAGRAQSKHHGGADVAVGCTLRLGERGKANNPAMMSGCIIGGCDSLHPIKKDPIGFRKCVANANRKLKE